MSDLIGQTLGGYRILSQIGKGGMATVYKAYQPSLERHVAIKVLPPYYAQQDETFLKRFRQEARAIARLRHPNILVALEYGEEAETTFIVMEYVEAGTLTDRLRQPMPLREAEAILRQVASALEYAHEQGVIHRDVKPSNILLPKPEWPLLTDFGLAKIVGGAQMTQTGSISGTPAYMSPEQGRGEPLDHRTDIYSLGIVLYEMATGAVPFTAETPMAVIVKHMIEPLPLPTKLNPDLPESVELVILKALAKDPKDRYAKAGDMAEALAEAVAHAPALAAAPTLAMAPVESPVPSIPTGDAQADNVAAPGKPTRRIGRWVLAGVGALALIATMVVLFTRPRVPAAQETAALLTSAPAAVSLQTTRTIDQHMADGRALLERGDLPSALAEFDAATSADPANIDRYWEIVGALKDFGYTDQAKEYLDLAVAHGPDEASFHDSLAWMYYDLGFHEEAIAHFQRILDLDPEDPWPFIGLADSFQAIGDLGQARHMLDSLAARPPVPDAELYADLGWGYLGLEAWPEAQTAFRRALSFDSGLTDVWVSLADATFSAQGVEAAWAVVQEGLKANPEAPPLHEKAGWLAREQGDMPGAEAAFRHSIELDPGYASGYAALAGLYHDQGRSQDAIAVLEMGINASPEEAWLHEALGQILLDIGEAEPAFHQLNTALELEPSSGWLALETASAYFEFSGDAQGTTEFLERAASLEPNEPDLLDSIGAVYEEMGNCGRAADYYRRTLELDPSIENSQAGLTRCRG